MEENSVGELPTGKYPWMKDLESTLKSTEGTIALESYLVQCEIRPLLEFIWACVGMKTIAQEDPQKGKRLILCIFANYIINGILPILSDQAVNNIGKRLEKQFERPEMCDIPSKKAHSSTKAGLFRPLSQIDSTIFDDARVEAEEYLRNVLFPCFQKSVASKSLFVPSGFNKESENGRRPWSVSSIISTSESSRLADDPEAFVKAICEKLESLIVSESEDES